MSEDSNRIFRKVALERLSSPDQLDQLVPALPAQAWLWLAPVLILIGLVLAWGWFGSVPTEVAGHALLVNGNGLDEVIATGNGRLAGLDAKPGDLVHAGQVMARIVQPELADRIEKAQSRLNELRALDRSQQPLRDESQKLAGQSAGQQVRNLQQQMAVEQERLRILHERLQTQEDLLAQGLVTRQQVLATRQDIANGEVDIEVLKTQVRQVELGRLDRDKTAREEQIVRTVQIDEAQRALDSLQKSQAAETVVNAPADGRLVELRSANGALVQQGQEIAVIEPLAAAGAPAAAAAADRMVALAYVPAGAGKRIARGMEARVLPSTVKREEHGYLVGTVDWISDYPVTPASMLLALHNDSLVREMVGAGVPVEVRIRLEPAATVSGYRWSTRAGPPLKLATGTPAAVEIVVDRERPLSLALPFLKKWLGLGG
ncbi:MAG: NHLP bacteriocin system secretion protein [Nevskia sp.]|nr:NHLP bacteriocin system secretion protein [Nevskia sp.]